MLSRLNGLRAVIRLLICLALGVATLIPALFCRMETGTAISLAWDVFCAGMIALSWMTFSTTSQAEVAQLAQREDESRTTIFILVLASVCISLVGILLLMMSTDATVARKEIHTAISLFGVALSWMLLHTVFTLRYAHMYYTDPAPDAASQVGGLNFPDEPSPDYMDIAYFAFVVGMTFQVSDVTISSRAIRRVVLLHGIISFVFNTIIVALTISFLSGIGKG